MFGAWWVQVYDIEECLGPGGCRYMVMYAFTHAHLRYTQTERDKGGIREGGGRWEERGGGIGGGAHEQTMVIT